MKTEQILLEEMEKQQWYEYLARLEFYGKLKEYEEDVE